MRPVWAVAGAVAAIVFIRWANREARRAKTPSDPYFSKDYAEAKQKFKGLATAVGAEQSSYVIGSDASLGVELTIDVAFIKGSSKTVLVHLSGTHGVEGFAGSAIQCAALTRIRDHPVEPDLNSPSILFVHAVNPYGFHFLRRFNERNVDLNRNFLLTEEEWSVVLARTPNQFHYEDVRPLLNPSRALHWYEWYPSVLWRIFKIRKFFKVVRKAVVTGQYHCADGLYYGGRTLEKSNQVLCDVISTHAKGAEVAVCIDVHSGLGDSGVDTLMVEDADPFNRFLPNLSFSGPGADSVSAGYEDTVGGVSIAAVLPQARLALHITQEFGTVAPVFVFWAMIYENAAFKHCTLWSSTRHWAALQLRDVFYVPTDKWRGDIVRRGLSLFDTTIARLRQEA